VCGATVGALQQKASHGSFVSLALVPCVARTTQHSTVSCASASGFLIGFVLKQCFQHFANQRRETCRILSASLTKVFASRSDAANNGFQVMGYHGWSSLQWLSDSNFAEQLRAVPNELLAKTIQLGKSWKLCLAWRYVAKAVLGVHRSNQADYPISDVVPLVPVPILRAISFDWLRSSRQGAANLATVCRTAQWRFCRHRIDLASPARNPTS